MHLGLIGGIGPAATDLYYRGLVRAAADRGVGLEMTVAHADAPTLIAAQAAGDAAGQAARFARLIERLKTAGAETAAVTSIAGHFCIEALKPISPLPLIDLLDVVAAGIEEQGVRRVGLIGTRTVMESRFYGRAPGLDIVVPEGDALGAVHEAYVAMAMSGVATEAQRETFFRAGRALASDQGAEAVMLGGTDLFLAFDGRDPGFATLDCAGMHIAALAEAAAR